MKKYVCTFIKRSWYVVTVLAVSFLMLGHDSCQSHPHPHESNQPSGKCTGEYVSCSSAYSDEPRGRCPPPCNQETIDPRHGGGFVCNGTGLTCDMFKSQRLCVSVKCNWVECTRDAECSAGKKCIRNICGACTNNDDCPLTQRCRAADKMCVTSRGPDGARCSRDGQCINACIDSVCASRRAPGNACGNNADCISRLCNGGVCGCSADTQCAAGQRCHSSGICVTANGPDGAPCNRDGQCINACIGGVCASRRAPGKTCANNADCISRLCNGGVCGCSADTQCAAGQRCHSNGTCVTANGADGAVCNRDGQCVNACIDGTCQPRRPAGQPCGNNADCQSRQCNGGICG